MEFIGAKNYRAPSFWGKENKSNNPQEKIDPHKKLRKKLLARLNKKSLQKKKLLKDGLDKKENEIKKLAKDAKNSFLKSTGDYQDENSPSNAKEGLTRHSKHLEEFAKDLKSVAIKTGSEYRDLSSIGSLPPVLQTMKDTGGNSGNEKASKTKNNKQSSSKEKDSGVKSVFKDNNSKNKGEVSMMSNNSKDINPFSFRASDIEAVSENEDETFFFLKHGVVFVCGKNTSGMAGVGEGVRHIESPRRVIVGSKDNKVVKVVRR